MGQCSNQLSHPAKALNILLNYALNITFEFVHIWYIFLPCFIYLLIGNFARAGETFLAMKGSNQQFSSMSTLCEGLLYIEIEL